MTKRKQRRIRVTPVRRDEPDLRRLARALIELAMSERTATPVEEKKAKKRRAA